MSFAVIEDFNEGKSAIKTDTDSYEKAETGICFLPDCIVNVMDSCTAVIIYCTEDVQDAVADRFQQIFEECYEKAMDAAEKDFNGEDLDSTEEEEDFFDEEEDFFDEEEGFFDEEEDSKDYVFCEERDYSLPLSGISKMAGGIIVQLGSLDLHEAIGGEHMYLSADSALENTLKTLSEEFPSITYEGHVADMRRDLHCGEALQYVFSSDKTHPDYPYQCTGAALASVLRNDDFWRYLSGDVYDEADYIEILQFFKLYPRSLPSDALNRLLTSSLECEEKEKCVMKEFRLLLLDYKNKYFPDADPLDELKLES